VALRWRDPVVSLSEFGARVQRSRHRALPNTWPKRERRSHCG